MSGKDITLTGVSNLEASQKYLKLFFLGGGELILVKLKITDVLFSSSNKW